MNLTEQINNDIKEAMKSGQKDRLMALRDIKSKLLLEATKGGDGVIDDTREIAILNKLYKQRMESIDIYRTQGREDLVAEELLQATVIQAYLPAQLGEAELEAEVARLIAETGAVSPAEMGKVMGAANKALAGKADGKAISEMVKKLLSK